MPSALIKLQGSQKLNKYENRRRLCVSKKSFIIGGRGKREDWGKDDLNALYICRKLSKNKFKIILRNLQIT